MSTPVAAATTVFVVDDDEPVRDSIKVLLEVHGFEVEDFASTAAFVKSYRKPARGCLILDQHLPMITGIDSLRSAVGRELGILVIGQGDPTLEHRARDAGVAEYPQKPIALKVLLDTIEQVIDAA